MGLGKKIGRFTLRHGYFFERAQKPQTVHRFLDLIEPVKTERELIRVGSAYDGGYLLPNDLDDIAACFSPGVKDNADFEFQIAEMGIPCFMADYSVNSAPIQHNLFDFEKKYIGSVSACNFLTLSDWIDAKAPQKGDILLQMDIEGFEYETILALPEDKLKRFRIMAIEFHDLDGIFSKRSLPIIEATFRKILLHFHIVHIHPNNCLPARRCGDLEALPVMEFTFLRKDRLSKLERTSNMSHSLDAPNKPDLPTAAIPRCWTD